MSVLPRQTIAEVKVRLEADTGITTDCQRIVLAGQTLQDSCTLLECGLADNAVVYFVTVAN